MRAGLGNRCRKGWVFRVRHTVIKREDRVQMWAMGFGIMIRRREERYWAMGLRECWAARCGLVTRRGIK